MRCSRAGLLLSLSGAAVAAPTPTGLVNTTVYRVSPLAYPGLLNMDTGDAGGDIGFGMWELVMPMECRGGSGHGPQIGCQNGTGKYIHPGDPTNVFEKFSVQHNPIMGTYHNCNPNVDGPEAGVFNCDSMDFGEGHCLCSGPGEVRTSYDYYHEDCLNGTVFKKLTANETACQTACTAAAQCAAFAVPLGPNGGVCHLMKEPLIQWNGGATVSPCRCAIRQQGSLDVPSDDCACFKFNHVAMGFQYQGNQAGIVPGMPCTVSTTKASCDNTDDCQWNNGGCFSYTCSNHTTQTQCEQDHWECKWNTTAATPYCGEFMCANYTTAASCNAQSDSDCAWDAGTCRGGWHSSPSHKWRETTEAMMAGHWYSTQAVGKCNSTDTATEAEDGDCAWRVAEVLNVVNADCVNNKIIAEVERRNASCFNALPTGQKGNRSSDGWITCLFHGLLGDRATGSPALKGGGLNTLAEVQELRSEILKLWTGAFMSDDSVTGCPTIPSNNTADPFDATQAPVGVEPLTLFVKGELQLDATQPDPASMAGVLTNRNSMDAPAFVLDALWRTARPTLCSESGTSGDDACLLPHSLLGDSSVSADTVVTQVKVLANTFYGQFANCAPAADAPWIAAAIANGTAVLDATDDAATWTCAADCEWLSSLSPPCFMGGKNWAATCV